MMRIMMQDSDLVRSRLAGPTLVEHARTCPQMRDCMRTFNFYYKVSQEESDKTVVRVTSVTTKAIV